MRQAKLLNVPITVTQNALPRAIRFERMHPIRETFHSFDDIVCIEYGQCHANDLTLFCFGPVCPTLKFLEAEEFQKVFVKKGCRRQMELGRVHIVLQCKVVLEDSFEHVEKVCFVRDRGGYFGRNNHADIIIIIILGVDVINVALIVGADLKGSLTKMCRSGWVKG